MSPFVRLALVAFLTFFTLPALAVQPTGSAGWTNGGWTNSDSSLLTGPGREYDEIGIVGGGLRVRVDRCTGLWCQIHAKNLKGWMELRNISFGQGPWKLFKGPKFPVRYGGPVNIDAIETVDARRGRVIATMNWDIAPDEALIMEFQAPPQWFWQMTACSVFGASLEYRYRQVSLTSGMAPVDRDGSTRVILSHADPGFANWIDLQGHTRGWLYYRNMFTRAIPDATTRVVPFDELEAHVGDLATRITPQERTSELRRRREANLRRFET